MAASSSSSRSRIVTTMMRMRRLAVRRVDVGLPIVLGTRTRIHAPHSRIREAVKHKLDVHGTPTPATAQAMAISPAVKQCLDVPGMLVQTAQISMGTKGDAKHNQPVLGMLPTAATSAEATRQLVRLDIQDVHGQQTRTALTITTPTRQPASQAMLDAPGKPRIAAISMETSQPVRVMLDAPGIQLTARLTQGTTYLASPTSLVLGQHLDLIVQRSTILTKGLVRRLAAAFGMGCRPATGRALGLTPQAALGHMIQATARVRGTQVSAQVRTTLAPAADHITSHALDRATTPTAQVVTTRMTAPATTAASIQSTERSTPNPKKEMTWCMN